MRLFRRTVLFDAFEATGSEISRITGMTMTKIARHGRMLDTAPPTVGPMAAPR